MLPVVLAGETCIRISVFDEADNTFKTIQIPVVIAPDDTISTEQQEQLAALKEKGNHLRTGIRYVSHHIPLYQT